MKVILDTDFIVNCMKFKIDITKELTRILDVKFDVFVIDKTIDELEVIDNGYSKMGLEWLDLKNIEEINTTSNKPVDDLILNLKDKDIIVCSQDKELKQLLNKKGVKTLTIRQEKYFKLD